MFAIVVSQATPQPPDPADKAAATRIAAVRWPGQRRTARGSRRQQVLRRRQAGAGRLVPPPARPHPCADRPERRRQEHDDQHAHRRHRAELPDRSASSARRSPACPFTAICALGMGRTFQNLRLFGDLSVLDNVHARPPHAHAERLLVVAVRTAVGARGRSAAARDCAHVDCSTLVGLAARWRTSPQAACPTACSGASSSPARSPPSRNCCCSTNRPRA